MSLVTVTAPAYSVDMAPEEGAQSPRGGAHVHPETRYPRYMSSDLERIELALELLDEAYSALCYIGLAYNAAVPMRPARVQKAIDRLDKAMTSLEKHRDGAL